jgi:hypothetical protein
LPPGVKLIKDMCDKYELKFNELKASVMNEHRTTENDELFAQVPDEDKYGMIAFIKKKKFFPPKRPPSSLLIPTHCLEFLRLSLFAFSHRCIGVIFKDWVQYFIFTLGKNFFFLMKAIILKENNIDIYPSRSEECYPCIYQMSVRELADIDESRIELINEFEVKEQLYQHYYHICFC